MKTARIIAETFILLGALNIGTLGFVDFDFIRYALGSSEMARVAYSLIGLAALYRVFCILTGVEKLKMK